jgi:DNA-binding CsgD family transcriptional regulator
MKPGLLPAGVLATIADDDVDPQTIVAEISTIAKSRRYAIFRLTRISRVHLDVIESTLDPEVSTYISGLLTDEASDFSVKTCASTVPFYWSFKSDPVVRNRANHKPAESWSEMAKSPFHVFFRRCSAAEKLVFVSQSAPDANPLDTEQLFCCHGLTQVIFDQLAMRAPSRAGSGVRITARERECLRWCAEGKTSEEIGIILSLSTHTVNHYLISATKKLNAVNRMHAITIAIRHGILDINSEP